MASKRMAEDTALAYYSKNEIASLQAKGVECAGTVEARRGSITKIRLPSGGELGRYEPKHPKP